MAVRNVEDVYPLSPMQEGLLFHSLYAQEHAVYVTHITCTLEELDVKAFERAWQQVVDRHPALRTAFVWQNLEKPLQVVAKRVRINLDVEDWRGLSKAEQDAGLNAFLQSEQNHDFKLTKAPLVRLTLFQIGPRTFQFVYSHHHLLLDGWSDYLLLQEVFTFYEAYHAGRALQLELPRPYRDYIAWLGQQDLSQAERFWRELLNGFNSPTVLSVDQSPGGLPSQDETTIYFRLPAEITDALRAQARRQGLTLNTLTQGVWALLLNGYSGQRDVVFGATVSGRPVEMKGVDKMLGVFINTLPVRARVVNEAPVLAWFRELQNAQLAMRQFEYSPLVQVQGWSDVPRGLPLFDTILDFENHTAGTSLEELGQTLRVSDVHTDIKMEYPLFVKATPGGELLFTISYDRKRFDDATIARLTGHLETLLSEVARADETKRMRELEWLSESERTQIVYEWNQTETAVDGELSIADEIAVRADEMGQAIALVCDGEELTYAELNARANQLGRYLQRCGVGPETVVGVCLERSIELVIALLGVLKAGGAYLPLDPSYPQERLSWMLSDAGVQVVLRDLPEIGQESREDLNADVTDENLAYVIYTSGSTGRPKGVMVQQGNVKNFFRGMDQSLSNDSGDGTQQTWLAVTSVSFDISVLELLWSLRRGSRVVIQTETGSIGEQLRRQRVTHLQCTPTLAGALLQDAETRAGLSGLEQLLCGGEALAGSLASALREAVAGTVHNMYGPTETTIWSATHVVSELDVETPIVSLGRPIANTQIYLLDEALQPVPVGVRGELYIGGDGVARGYWNRGELTAERFVPDPFSRRGGQRMYRTGDEARYLASGEIEYLGRSDQQVKLRGYRIELGEIEAALREHESVNSAAVAVRGERLVAYVVGAIDRDALRERLQQRLPDYMVPGHYVSLDALPQTPNGKLDRKALPEPEAVAGAEYEAPRTPVEEVLAAIIAEVLAVPRVGRQDHFFALGGHSLLAMQVISRIREAFQVELPVRALFESPTIAGLGRYLEYGAEKVAAPLLRRVDRDQPLPLSFAQQRLWFLDRFEADRYIYNMAVRVELRGPVEHERLQESLNRLLRRHEVLRSSFREVEGRVVQVISDVTLALPLIEAADLTDAERIAAEELVEPFDLGQAPLMRARLLRRGDDDHLVLLTLHHAVCDGWSLGVLFRELVTYYEHGALPELPVQYGDYAVWQREWLQGEVLETQLNYWRERLEGAPAALELATDYPRPALHRYRAATLSYELGVDLSREIQALSRREGVTLLMLLLASLQVLLSRYTNSQDISVGLPIAGRNRVESESLVGLFLNTLVLRTEWAGDPTFRELLAKVRELALSAYAHQDLPFEKLVEELQPERDLSRTPLFQVMLVLQNAPLQVPPLKELEVGKFEVATRSTNYDLTVSINESDSGLEILLDYNALLFKEERMQRLLRHWERLLQSVVATPNKKLSHLQWLTDSEREQLVYGWNQTEQQYDTSTTVVDLIEQQVAQRPNEVAVVSGTEQLTYAELNNRANQVAQYLREQGVGPESVVGVCLERTASLPVALLGVLKSGGAYLPLDPSYPRERLTWILEDAGVQVLLTEEHTGTRIDTDLEKTICSENLAYLIYTSGSTGRPKGVQVTHGNLVNFLWSMQAQPGLTADDTLVAVTTLSFDIAGLEIYLPLISGGRLVLASRETATDGRQLLQLLRESGATVMQATPATWRLLLDALEGTDERIRLKVLCGGEALPGSLVAALRERIDGPIYNLYGPTETTIWSALHEVAETDAETPIVSLGRPIANTQLYLLDEALQPVPVGVRGELYIGGDGVARGYWKRGELTAERFVPDPFSKCDGQRLYRTGDEARFLANGEIEYLGRSDQQVKLRGYRIELGEIEAALREHESAHSAAVAVRGDRLVAYIVGEASDNVVLRQHLQQRLPDYMVPSTFIHLAALPQTPNGKLDRKALPEPEAGATEAEYEAPRTPVEEVLAAIVAEVLQLPRVGRHDDFFALGGHSLLAMQVVSRIREAFHVELPVRTLFETPTLARLAHQIEGCQIEKPDAPPLTPVSRDTALQLSFAQQRLWFLDQLESGSPLYNIPAAVRLTGHLNFHALEQTFDEVLRRHESLRTRFIEVNGRAVQVIEPELKLNLSIEDLQHLTPDAQQAEVLQRSHDEGRKPFNLSQSPLLRVKLLRLAGEAHVMLVTIHHIIGDEWSMGVLVRDMATLYSSYAHVQPSPLPDLRVQYADYGAWQREWLQGEFLNTEIDYWRHQLDRLPVLDLPTDRPRPAVQTYHGARYSFDLAPELSNAIDTLAREQRTTRFMTLLAAFLTLLHRYSTQDDIVIGTPIAGRSRLETESLIGLFVNTLVLRGDLSGDPEFTELLHRVRDTAFAAYAHQDVPFEKLVEQLKPERDLSRTPLFQVGFVLQNDPLQSIEVPGLKMEPIPVDTGTAKFDLLLAMVEEPGGLRGSVEYNTDLFDAETVARMARHFRNLLGSIVAEPEERLSRLRMLAEDERAELVHAKTQRRTQRRKEESLSRLFEVQVEKNPNAVAITLEDVSINYRELNARANQLARHLRNQGVGPETIVGISLERNLALPVALLAVLKAGGAYLPLDPSYPRERVSWMIADARAEIVITEEYLERNAEEITAQSRTDLESRVGSENLAYVIYTSGSTGNPKGVQVTHANVMRLFAATEAQFRFDENDVWTFFHSFAFDFSVWEIWGALLYGGRLVIVPYLVSRTPQDFYQLLRAEGVTILNQTPSSFLQLIKHEHDAGPADDLKLRLVIFGGEALDLPSLRPWIANHGDRKPLLVNMYGITETTVHVTYRPLRAVDIEQERGSLIGDAIDDLQLYILDQHQQPVPLRVPGELCVGGAGVARGYLNSPELTAQKFIPDPYSAIPGSRLYRSGDSARRLPAGETEYLGRLDQQVKIRGFRIELGEIEAALVQHPAVRECVVMAREDTPGEKQLTAYIVGRAGATPNVSELRNSLKLRLPEYMVPASFVLLSEFPLTANGKLDRRALPAPDNVRPELAGAYVAPETTVEKHLAQVWSEVLHLDRVGVNDSFFALGGDSIRSIEVRARAEQLGIEFSLQQLFQFQTIGELCQQLNGSSSQTVDVALASLLTDSDRQNLPDGVDDAYPLAMLQAGMLFHSEFDSDAATYHDVFSFRLRAPFDESALRDAIERVMERHAVLRTSFDVSSFSEPLQLIHRATPVPLAVEDLLHLTPDDQQSAIAAWLAAEQKTRFDWTHPPLFRIQMHRRSERDFQFSLSFHHAILDGWSVASLLTEFFQTYLANLGQTVKQTESLPETVYRDFIALEKQALRSDDAKHFWQQKLEGASSSRLPRWSIRSEKSDESRVLTTPVPRDVFRGLKQLAEVVSAPLKSVLLAAHLRVLSLLSGQPEVITGLVSNGRPEQRDGERTLGLFLNTLPVRAPLNGGTWEDLVRETLAAERELLPFRWYPLASMQQQRGGEALFETGFSFNHFHVYERLRGLDGIEVLDEHVFEQTNFTLGTIFNVDSTSSHLQLQLNYNAGELASEQVDSIAGYYLETLRRMAADPTSQYEAVCLLPQPEQQRLLVEWNQTQAEFSGDRCIHEWFEEQVASTPHAVAVICEGEQLTYRELNARANQLAHHLRSQGVGPETIVGVSLERSLSLPVALLAVLKAGGAYVPLDPSYPQERLSWMLADASAQIVLTEDYLKGNAVEIETRSDTDLENRISSENLAYVIYTSGSTGRPKGVMITHRGVCNTLRWRQVAFSLSETDRILQTISIAFDPSVWQIFGSLVTGSCLVLAKPGGDKDVRYLLNVFREQEITIADFVPSMLQAFLEQEPQDACQHLQHVFCGGEVLPAELLDRYLKTMPGRIHNMYGPTEGTIDAACWTCERLRGGESVSIGRPVANKRIYLLDRHLQPVPTGVPGELHIGGVGLARGYLNQPQMSAEKLIPDPFSNEPGARLYRTGDLARYLPDGRLEFLGRMDQQVKVRGFRIELEEIEAALASHEMVEAAVVVARERTKGVKDLVAYVVADKTASLVELRAHLRARLPEYMVPAYFVVLDQLPLTPNGKLDRRALPAPGESRPQTEIVYLEPRNEIEQILAQVWQETLQLDHVGVHDNFFDLGGHSLLMLRIQGKVRTLFNRDLSIVEMFRYPTISSLAELLGSEAPETRSLEDTHERAAAARAATRRRRELRKSQPVA